MRHARRYFRPTSAESIIETIIAITVIVMGAAAALSMLRSSLSGNELVGKKVVAIQLAMEGLDALRNVRDTNYLLFAADADACWMTLGLTDSEDCAVVSDPADILTEGQIYYFSRDWSTAAAPGWQILPVEASEDGYEDLYGVDLDGGGDDLELYAQTGLSDFSVLESRAFYRTAQIVYSPAGDSYDATITVTWEEHGNSHSISRTERIPNLY